jgi:hypothetical protein
MVKKSKTPAPASQALSEGFLPLVQQANESPAAPPVPALAAAHANKAQQRQSAAPSTSFSPSGSRVAYIG